jgi:hypothetical protein
MVVVWGGGGIIACAMMTGTRRGGWTTEAGRGGSADRWAGRRRCATAPSGWPRPRLSQFDAVPPVGPEKNTDVKQIFKKMCTAEFWPVFRIPVFQKNGNENWHKWIFSSFELTPLNFLLTRYPTCYRYLLKIFVTKLEIWKKQCCGSGSGIRCLFDPWIRDPGSGIGFFRIPDPKPIFLRASWPFFW